MAWYVELHCDNGTDCPHGGGYEGPQGRDKAEVWRQAKRLGWQRFGRRTLCPGCARDRG